jgi:hypothetical protein
MALLGTVAGTLVHTSGGLKPRAMAMSAARGKTTSMIPPEGRGGGGQMDVVVSKSGAVCVR